MANITERKRKDGISFKITVSCGRNSAGKQILKATTFRPDMYTDKGNLKTEKTLRKEAENFARDFEAKILSGNFTNNHKITFEEFSKKYLTEYSAIELSPTTHINYKREIEKRLIPEFGHMKLLDIKTLRIQEFYNNLARAGKRMDSKEKEGLSFGTIKKSIATFSSVMSKAVEWGFITQNPIQNVRTPRHGTKNNLIKHFSLEQTERFLEALELPLVTTYKAHNRIDDTGKTYHVNEYQGTRWIPLQYKLFFHLALFGGFRRGEIVALQWSDIDFDTRIVSITKNTVSIKETLITKEPKNTSSIRRVKIPIFMIEMAQEWKKEQINLAQKLGTQWIGQGHIFTQWNGAQMHPDSPYSTFIKVIRNYNASIENPDEALPEIPLHGLRHTSATLLVSQNIDIQTISGRLGHTQTSTTMNIYAHSLEKMDDVASSTLDSLIPHK